MAGGFAARRIDQAELRIGTNLTVLALLALGNQQPGKDAGVAEQALEPLVRGRLPAIERLAGVGIDAARLDAHEQLPAAVAVA
ncbi:hypothetical protein NKJ13_21110 [Mesorhizobium sp. M0174]|uniref:hypothetical protein n=1 Tax=Mesorhizobium sp. M0174 TaxID=2956904 RepID=UPI00333C1918